jgi:GT2 family glycosyltransferase
MALIAMAVYSTDENRKDECLEKTLHGLKQTVNFKRHRLMLSVNGSTITTREIINDFKDIISYAFWNEKNLGTAAAINKIWKHRMHGEHAIKMDDDITIHQSGWADDMEEAIKADPLIGQIGLKRRDLWEYPTNPDPDYKSELIMLPHVPGENWLVVEKVRHCIGSCVMHSSACLDKVGFLHQLSTYGFDDVIMSHRTHLAGFYSCFFPYIKIDHTDPGGTEYQAWKQKHSGEYIHQMVAFVQEMYRGAKPFYYED